jgi:bacterioferritin-associated ferredoxin
VRGDYFAMLDTTSASPPTADFASFCLATVLYRVLEGAYLVCLRSNVCNHSREYTLARYAELCGHELKAMRRAFSLKNKCALCMRSALQICIYMYMRLLT